MGAPAQQVLEPAARATNELYERGVASAGDERIAADHEFHFDSASAHLYGNQPGQFEMTSLVRSRQLERNLDSMFVQLDAIDEKSQRLSRFCFGLEPFAPSVCGLENRFHAHRIPVHVLHLGGDTRTIPENRACSGCQAAFKFSGWNPPASVGLLCCAGNQATRDVVSIATCALHRMARSQRSSRFVEELAGKRATH